MLYDQYGRLIPETRTAKPVSGMQIVMEPLTDRESRDVSRGLTPRDVDRVLLQANGGDVEAQCRLSRELPEKSPAVAHALRTRRNALTGCGWHVEPGDESPAAREAAKRLEKDLDATGAMHPELGKVGSFSRLLRDLSDAVLPGFSAAEILWRPGGCGFYGFRPVEQRFFSFADSYTPRLRTKGNLYEGIPLEHGKLIFHELYDGSDPVRGGLIRPLVWMFCFSQINQKDLLSFIERYGMPFVRATVDQATWDKEKTTLNDLICNFGPRGGGVFSRGVEVELLQAPNINGDVYFRLQQYLDDAITKVLLGQTASSGDGGGLSGDTAQSEVRDDILCADARALEDTINRDLFAVWMEYNYPAGTPCPRLRIETEPPEDEKASADKKLVKAQVIQTLASAGYIIPEEEIRRDFGYHVTYQAPMKPQEPGPFGQFGQSGQSEPGGMETPAENNNELPPDKKAIMYGALIRGGMLTPTRDLEEKIRAELGLAPLPEEAAKLWDESGGVRKPLTIKDPTEASAPAGGMELSETDKKKEPPGLIEALEAWFGGEVDQIAATAELSDEELDRELRNGAPAIVQSILQSDSGKMEELDSDNMRRSYDNGNQIRG